TIRTTYTYTFEAIGFGAPQARVLFDLGADSGVVNIDNVSLILE
ncbi:MAG: carbohydrate-binding protein, partial [Flavobacteriaceae bacterium]|nr:carbohydrate-binding protein [Flavobacteriaceae bacterium]